jgi:hypothetical protein
MTELAVTIEEATIEEAGNPREIVRTTALRVLHGDDLSEGEKEMAAGILRATPALGNPHAVRCGWCRETRTLFRDESDGPFKLTRFGWRCEPCDTNASNQEIRF